MGGVVQAPYGKKATLVICAKHVLYLQPTGDRMELLCRPKNQRHREIGLFESVQIGYFEFPYNLAFWRAKQAMGRKYEGILDFNQQVDYTFTPITYEMISHHL